ncbi:pkd2, partial [Symbiodinium pilosum]
VHGFLGNEAASHMPRPLLCASLVVTLIYWMLFVYSQAVHQNSFVSWEVRATFRNFDDNVLQRGGKAIRSGDDSPDESVLQDFEEAYDWLREGYMPMLWQEGPRGRGYLANRIRLVGGVRLSRQRSAPPRCAEAESSAQPWMDIIYNESCSIGAQSDGQQDSHWLDISHNLSSVIAHLDHLQQTGWLSDGTN